MYWEHFGERKRVSRGKSKDVGAAFRDKPSEKSILAMNSGLCGRDLVGIGIGGTWVERLCERPETAGRMGRTVHCILGCIKLNACKVKLFRGLLIDPQVLFAVG
jgi:hypothetical protein